MNLEALSTCSEIPEPDCLKEKLRVVGESETSEQDRIRILIQRIRNDREALSRLIK